MIFDLSNHRRWRRLRSSRPLLELHLSTGWYEQASCRSLYISASLSKGCSDGETEPLAGALFTCSGGATIPEKNAVLGTAGQADHIASLVCGLRTGQQPAHS